MIFYYLITKNEIFLFISLFISSSPSFDVQARWATQKDADTAVEQGPTVHIRADGTSTRQYELKIKILAERAKTPYKLT